MKLRNFLFVISSVFSIAGCQSGYNLSVDLSEEEKQKWLVAIQENSQEIVTLKERGEETYYQTIDLAGAYEALGRLDESVQIYVDYIQEDPNSIVMYNNLGRLYEKANDHNKAIEQYQILVDQFDQKDYLHDIVLIYLRTKNPKKAQEYLDLWKEATGETDDFSQKRIDKMME